MVNKVIQEYLDADFLTPVSHTERENKMFSKKTGKSD